MSSEGYQVARFVAVAVIGVQVLSIASWITAGALAAHYSPWRHGISDLGSTAARHPWIANGGLILLGGSVGLVALPLRQLLPRQRYVLVGVAFGLAGLGAKVEDGG
jgi:hypothetical membrane protein